MKNISNRLDLVEESLFPKREFALGFFRGHCEESDAQKQYQEYERMYGSLEGITFILLQCFNYNEDDNVPYERFIEKERRRSGKCNPLGWWPEVPDPIQE